MTVVAADGEYVKPFTVTAALLSPGQTTDVLVTADQPKGNLRHTEFDILSFDKTFFGKLVHYDIYLVLLHMISIVPLESTFNSTGLFVGKELVSYNFPLVVFHSTSIKQFPLVVYAWR